MKTTPPPEIVIGTEIRSDCHPVGRVPRTMKPDELRAVGHVPMAPLAALRLRCLDCCGGSADEVRKCMALTCPAWLFHMGANPVAGAAQRGREAPLSLDCKGM
jgi:hypothetical protein